MPYFVRRQSFVFHHKMWLWLGLIIGLVIGLVIGIGIGFSLYARAGTWD